MHNVKRLRYEETAGRTDGNLTARIIDVSQAEEHEHKEAYMGKVLGWLLLVMALAGCETAPRQEMVWRKGGATQQDFYMDSGQCSAQAQAAMAGRPIPMGNPTALSYYIVQQRSIENSCMQGKGWYLTPR